MMPLSDWTGLSGLGLVWMLLALRLPLAQRYMALRRVLFALAIYGAALLPVMGWSLAGWLRGMTGDLSMPSVLLLGSAVYARLRMEPGVAPHSVWGERERIAMAGLWSLFALLLYPCALGVGMTDPYRFGYGGMVLAGMLGLMAVAAWWRNLFLLPLAIALAVLAWAMGWGESANLWDYLIDVPLACYALGVVLKWLWMKGRRRRG